MDKLSITNKLIRYMLLYNQYALKDFTDILRTNLLIFIMKASL